MFSNSKHAERWKAWKLAFNGIASAAIFQVHERCFTSPLSDLNFKMRDGPMAHLKTVCGPPVGHCPPVGNHWSRLSIKGSHKKLSKQSRRTNKFEKPLSSVNIPLNVAMTLVRSLRTITFSSRRRTSLRFNGRKQAARYGGARGFSAVHATVILGFSAKIRVNR